MKVDNLMKSFENNEKSVSLTAFIFHFSVQMNFPQKLFFDFKVTNFCTQKQNNGESENDLKKCSTQAIVMEGRI